MTILKHQLRVARATNDLKRISEMYIAGLNYKMLAEFKAHNGFDGIMIGDPDCHFHFEFTQEFGVKAPQNHSNENLVVVYCSGEAEHAQRTESMLAAGFTQVKAHNPYWNANGTTFQDFEDYLVVICRSPWLV